MVKNFCFSFVVFAFGWNLPYWVRSKTPEAIDEIAMVVLFCLFCMIDNPIRRCLSSLYPVRGNN